MIKPKSDYIIRSAKPDEHEEIGDLLVNVYSKLEGFPSPDDQPDYYKLLKNIGDLTIKEGTEIIVAVNETGELHAALVYFNDMQNYGSGGTATMEKNASGFRLLAVAPVARGKGLGKIMTEHCIQKTKTSGNSQLIIHTTKAMKVAWKMYEKMGFQRSVDLDFMQQDLEVFGFRYKV